MAQHWNRCRIGLNHGSTADDGDTPNDLVPLVLGADGLPSGDLASSQDASLSSSGHSPIETSLLPLPPWSFGPRQPFQSSIRASPVATGFGGASASELSASQAQEFLSLLELHPIPPLPLTFHLSPLSQSPLSPLPPFLLLYVFLIFVFLLLVRLLIPLLLLF